MTKSPDRCIQSCTLFKLTRTLIILSITLIGLSFILIKLSILSNLIFTIFLLLPTLVVTFITIVFTFFTLLVAILGLVVVTLAALLEKSLKVCGHGWKHQSASNVGPVNMCDITEVDSAPVSMQFNNAIDRLASFTGWPSRHVTPQSLASAGFYYKGYRDVVKCPFCIIEVGRWEAGDEAWVEHRKWSPNCPFLRSRSYGVLYISRNFSRKEDEMLWEVSFTTHDNNSTHSKFSSNVFPMELLKRKLITLHLEDFPKLFVFGRETQEIVEMLFGRKSINVAILDEQPSIKLSSLFSNRCVQHEPDHVCSLSIVRVISNWVKDGNYQRILDGKEKTSVIY